MRPTFDVMVAMTRLDLAVGLSWIGLLASVLVAQAAFVWWRYRWAARLASKAERLARSIGERPKPTSLPRMDPAAGPAPTPNGEAADVPPVRSAPLGRAS